MDDNKLNNNISEFNNANENNEEINNVSEFENTNENNEENIKQFNNSENITPENNNKEEKEEKNKWFWIIYIAIVIIIFIIILLLLRACNGVRSKNKNKIIETNEWVTNMWNKCVDPIYWYTVDGTGTNGSDINIDSVLNNCDIYYKEYKEKNSYVSSLDDEYADFKEYYSKISEQIEIIYPKIKANKPVAEVSVDYEENMEILYDYQVKLYNLVKEKYSEG